MKAISTSQSETETVCKVQYDVTLASQSKTKHLFPKRKSMLNRIPIGRARLPDVSGIMSISFLASAVIVKHFGSTHRYECIYHAFYNKYPAIINTHTLYPTHPYLCINTRTFIFERIRIQTYSGFKTISILNFIKSNLFTVTVIFFLYSLSFSKEKPLHSIC